MLRIIEKWNPTKWQDNYGREGKLINQVTKGNWDVTDYYGFDQRTGRIYFQSTENGSINRDVFSIKMNGKNKAQLTQKRGTNSADFSSDFSYFINFQPVKT